MKRHNGGVRLNVRERIAPKPKQQAGVGGWFEWELVDRTGGVRHGGEHHNLVLDTMLDRFANTAPVAVDFFTHCAVGTSSVEPETDDVALGAELARTATVISRDTDSTWPGNTITLRKEWEFDFNQANGNLTEVGLAWAASGGIGVRALFRDAGGDPITLTKTSEFKLRIVYRWHFVFPDIAAAYTPGSIDIDGVGNLGMSWGWHLAGLSWSGSPPPQPPSLGAVSAVFNSVASGTRGAGTSARVGDGYLSGVTPASPLEFKSFGSSSSAATSARLSFSSFTPGVWERSGSVDFGTSVVVSSVATLGVVSDRGQAGGVSNQALLGFVIVLDSEDKFQKDNEHILRIPDLITVSWDRE